MPIGPHGVPLPQNLTPLPGGGFANPNAGQPAPQMGTPVQNAQGHWTMPGSPNGMAAAGTPWWATSNPGQTLAGRFAGTPYASQIGNYLQALSGHFQMPQMQAQGQVTPQPRQPLNPSSGYQDQSGQFNRSGYYQSLAAGPQFGRY